VLPESYRSSTLILVESQKVPENYVKAIVGPSIEERLSSIQQQVLSRTLLTQTIQEFDLYPEEVRKNHGMDTVIERLRKDITVTTIGARNGRAGIDAFSISYVNENPVLAMKVTAKLASHFIEENLKVREQLVEGTSEFLDQELAVAKGLLEEQERAISQFKTKYMGELPEQVQANISALDRLQLQQGTVIEGLQKASDRLTVLEKTIKDYQAEGKGSVVTAPGPGANGKGIDPLAIRLQELEKNLASLSSEYKENYPDIVQLKQEIRTLKAQLGSRAAEKPASEQGSDALRSEQIVDPYLREMVKQREEAKLEIASLKERLARIREQVKEYEARVEKAPSREQELMILERDYANLKENYRVLLDKKLNARLSENLERRQKGERFRIIDPANLPSKPEKPDRVKIMLLGLLAGCSLGVGSAVGLEMLRPVFRRSEDVESLLHLRVIATIPSFKNLMRDARRRVPGSFGTLSNGLSRFLLTGHVSMGGRESSQVDHLIPTGTRSRRPESKYLAGATVLRGFELIGKWNPWSVVAEQFRVAATRLALLQSSGRGKVTVVTSAVKGEGKSVVAANLAYTLARDIGKSTLLIDGDLKCPSVHHYWGMSQSPGLKDVLGGSQSLESCLRQEGELPLWILPSGSERGRAGDDLSRIRHIAEILNELKEKYDHVIIDGPPVLPLADMQVMAGMTDTIAFVIRAGLTPRSAVENALRTLGDTTKTYIILNELETRGMPYYMQEGYEYFSETRETGVQ
jgi:polysaccharide chain length determinant protein (PEP-CTERM system associated)